MPPPLDPSRPRPSRPGRRACAQRRPALRWLWTAGCAGRSASPPPPLRSPRPEDACLGRAAGGDLALRPRQVCGRGGLRVPGWEARAACAALDPRLLLPRAVRAPLTQRNTLTLPHWLPGLVPGSLSASRGLPRGLLSVTPQSPTRTPGNYSSACRNPRPRGDRPPSGVCGDRAAQGGGRRKQRGWQESLRRSLSCPAVSRKPWAWGTTGRVVDRSLNGEASGPAGSRDLAPGTARSPPQHFQTQGEGQFCVLEKAT